MKTTCKNIIKTIVAYCLLQAITLYSFSQVNYASGNLQLVINGTSTLHDWDMKSSQGNCQAVFVVNNAGQITGISSLVFSTPVSGLKSGKSSMDNNAYKALKNGANPNITYTMTSATITPAQGGAFLVKSTGRLSIAGAVMNTDVLATCRLNADNSIAVSGTKNISMHDFNVSPPSFMMGTIKTGHALVLNFNGLLRK